jgi:hypothetical protein
MKKKPKEEEYFGISHHCDKPVELNSEEFSPLNLQI